MKHITYSEKSVLMGDEAAETLMEYAKYLARASTADTVDVNAIGLDGNDMVATFLVGPATIMIAETMHSSAVEPDNSVAIAYMRERIDFMVSPPPAVPQKPGNVEYFDSSDTWN